MNFRRPKAESEVIMLEQKAPIIRIDFDALLKMNAYVDNCESEIGWLGRVETIHGVQFITEVYLFEQEVDGTTTEISPEGLQDFAEELLTEEDGLEKWNQIRMWGHSHVNMSTSPSWQDDDQMLEFMKTGHPFFLRLIANKKGEVRIDYYDYENKLCYQNIEWEISYPAEVTEYLRQMQELEDKFNHFRDHLIESIQQQVKPEIRALVTEKRKTRSYPWMTPQTENENFHDMFNGEYDGRW